jgi:hypothetical protein
MTFAGFLASASSHRCCNWISGAPQQPLIAATQFVDNKQYDAHIALETDAEFLAKFNGDTAAAIDYIGDLMGCE